jgi:hypothetical protein
MTNLTEKRKALSAKARKAQSVKAAKASAKKCKDATAKRDKGIYLAFNFLSGNYQANEDRLLALDYLNKQCDNKPNLDGQSALRKLADAHGIGRSAIRKIVLKYKARLNQLGTR